MKKVIEGQLNLDLKKGARLKRKTVNGTYSTYSSEVKNGKIP